MEQKELLDAIEEKVSVAKKNWQSEVDKKGAEFSAKLETAIEKLKEESKDFDTKNSSKFEDFKKAMEKDFDSLSATLTEKGTDTKSISFKEAVTKSIHKDADKLKEAHARGYQHTMEFKDMGFEDFANYGTFTQDIRNTVIPTMEESFHVRNILSRGTTGGSVVHYPKALGKTGLGPNVWDYNRTAVESTVAKPDFEMTFGSVTAPVKWIAGILRLPVEMLDDLPWLTSYLATYAPIELLKVEDFQLLNGDGLGLNINGLINTAVDYNGTYTVGIERIIDAAYGQLGQNDFDMPTNVLLNPRDIVGIMLNKAAGGAGTYDLPEGTVGIVGGRMQIGGLTVNKTNKISQGDFLVGDFVRGASLITRSAPQLRFFEQDRDNVIKNMITVRIEERIALAKFYEDAFVYGSLNAGS